MYRLNGWFPNGNMGGAGFCIILTQKWKEAVSNSNINQANVNNLIQNVGNKILEAHGRKAVESHMLPCYFSVKWGEWGPEHITVPGNACGLDIDTRCLGCLPDEVALTPHNVDSVFQTSMILTLFVYLAEVLESDEYLRNRN